MTGSLISNSDADIIIRHMKILQTSNIYLGRYFEDNYTAGNKLRAGIKSIFSHIIDTAKDEKVDLVIFAGNIFDNLDLSQNLLDFFVAETARLGDIPAVLFPGDRDPYQAGSFWDYWRISQPSDNLYLLAGKKPVQFDLPNLSLTIYGVPVDTGLSAHGQLDNLKKKGPLKNHIAVTNGARSEHGGLINLNPFTTFGFNYIAVTGGDNYKEYSDLTVKAVSSGSPLGLWPEDEKSGGVAMINIDGDSISTELKKIQSFEWRTTEISMDTIHNIDDLKSRILEFAGPNTLLRVRLTGLLLLEAGFNIEHLRNELEENFLDLQFEDETRVLPKNISEVKVQEKTVLGQYLKVMVGRLNDANDSEQQKFERSLKIGYSLLSGREVW
jgi:DNA repair exonuclease SbcCD nuclease subunit